MEAAGMKSFNSKQRVADTSIVCSCLKTKSKRLLQFKWDYSWMENTSASTKEECTSGTTSKVTPLMRSYLDQVTEKT